MEEDDRLCILKASGGGDEEEDSIPKGGADQPSKSVKLFTVDSLVVTSKTVEEAMTPIESTSFLDVNSKLAWQ